MKEWLKILKYSENGEDKFLKDDSTVGGCKPKQPASGKQHARLKRTEKHKNENVRKPQHHTNNNGAIDYTPSMKA